MKTKAKLLLLAIAFAQIFLIESNSFAQTSISITYAHVDSAITYCPAPATPYFNVYGDAVGYTVGLDSVSIFINFGDGSDTTLKSPLWNGNSNLIFSIETMHTYSSPGIYSPQYIVTGPDGKADTVTNYNEVVIADTCGNLSGMLYIDNNSNCIYDAGDDVVPWAPVYLSLGGNVAEIGYSNANGIYYLSPANGYTYTLDVNNLSSLGYTPTCPSSGTVSFTAAGAVVYDFALACVSGFDLSGYVSGYGFRPGFYGSLYLTADNASCWPTSGTISLTLDPLTSFVNSYYNPPDNINSNTLSWNFTNATNAYWNSFWEYITVLTSASANIGDTVCFTVEVTPTVGDNDTTNNTYTVCYPVTNSWDPNDKAVSPAGVGASGDVVPNTEFTYTVRFQNTGNAEAINVSITDTLDSDLDMSTFQVLSSSHSMTPEINGHLVKFNFNNIMLPDSGTDEPGSHGTVIYKINMTPNLSDGIQITNTAHIFFDFNPAVVTNTTLNTVNSQVMSVKEIIEDNIAQIYPNPAEDIIKINFNNKVVGEISLVDILGKELVTQKLEGRTVQLNLSNLPVGIYYIQLNENNNISHEKITIVR